MLTTRWLVWLAGLLADGAWYSMDGCRSDKCGRGFPTKQKLTRHAATHGEDEARPSEQCSQGSRRGGSISGSSASGEAGEGLWNPCVRLCLCAEEPMCACVVCLLPVLGGGRVCCLSVLCGCGVGWLSVCVSVVVVSMCGCPSPEPRPCPEPGCGQVLATYSLLRTHMAEHNKK